MTGQLNGSAAMPLTPRQVGTSWAITWEAFMRRHGIGSAMFSKKAGADDEGSLVIGACVDELRRRGIRVVSMNAIPTAVAAQNGTTIVVLTFLVETTSGEPPRILAP